FGVDPASDLLEFALDDNDTSDNPDDDVLELKINLTGSFSKSLNVEIPNVNLGGSGVVEFGGAATSSASGGATLRLHVGVGLKDPSKIYLYQTSGLYNGNLTLAGSDMAFRAALGPFSLLDRKSVV